MPIWTMFLDLLRVSLFALAHVCGGSLGGGILLLSLIVRLALLPLTLRLAIRAREHQLLQKSLEPQLLALNKKYRRNRARLLEERGKLYAAKGIGPAPRGTLTGALVQLPIGAGVYQTIASIARSTARFLWVKDLGRPDAIVASIAAGLAGAAVVAGPTSPSTRVSAALAAGVTFLLAWRLSAGVGLYWVASNVVTVVQSLLLRRSVVKQAA